MLTTARIAELIALPLIWGGLVYGATSMQHLPSLGSHSVCGPWGCGPPTSALLAMHASWLALIAPPMLYIPYRAEWPAVAMWRAGLGMIGIGSLGLIGIAAWQCINWLPAAGPAAQEYLMQRCFFSIATAVDWPLIQTAFIGLILAIAGRRSTPAAE